MKKIALFASGNGTNVQRIIEYFNNNQKVNVSLVLTNNSKAGVIKRAKDLRVRYLLFSKDDFYHSSKIVDVLNEHDIDMIVLAGFLWLIPVNIIKVFSGKIVNIHPALLPKYGGKGMYGRYVHEKVIQNQEKESGITIHYVNEKYDDGQIIFQAKTAIEKKDTPDSLAQKIHQLEYEHFPRVIEKLLLL